MSTQATSRVDRRNQGPAAIYSWIFGAAFLVVGIWGFFETGFDTWAATETDASVLWFQVNGLHNVVHLLVGAALLAGAASGERNASIIALMVAVAYAIVGIAGFWATGAEWNVLAVNTADNWLHLGTAALGFAAVAASSSQSAPATRGARRAPSGRHQTA